MKATSIPNHEKTFFETGRDSDGKEFVLTEMTVPIKGTDQVMPYINCRPKNGDTSFYYQEQHTKTQIVLHYTAGYLKGDVAALSKPTREVSTPFIIARNGKILNLWSSAYWSYHLGSGAIGGNTRGSKQTIGIEISNIGFLKRIGNKLVTVYSDTDVYCDINEKQFYTKLESPYRGELYYARFTRLQYDSLLTLLRYLTVTYNIQRAFLPEDRRYITGVKEELVNFNGIVSHVNYRSSGKWDIGPAFEWEKIIDELR
ncbi:N-acetylmuramoyl-L-alanine amidase [Ascidiimonas sp. W6]|uniref:N-acetylmuramoyl-L-alanine amidase n=1 Tax=Ascidiimonas meishanensis TaxID=3128903 RepID=UPI0030EDA6C0